MSIPRTLGELQLHRILQRANLLSYYDTFLQQGGDDVQQLCEAGEEEFLEIMALVGMATRPLHVRRLQRALREWATNPTLFSQPLPNVSVSSTSVAKSCDAVMGRRSLRNPGDNQERLNSITKSPEKLLPFQQWSGRLSPDPDSNNEEEQLSPHFSPDGSLELDSIKAVADIVERLMKTVPRADPGEIQSLLKLNKKLARSMGHIFIMNPQDPAKEEEIRKYSLIYGRFDPKRREGRQLSLQELTVNEAAAQFCIRDNALLLRRVELFSLARQVARECAYNFMLKRARLNPDETNGPQFKKIKQEVMVFECVSSSHGINDSSRHTGPETAPLGYRQGSEDDICSFPGESFSGNPQGSGSRSSLASSPCHPIDTPSDPPLDLRTHGSRSRNHPQQTLMDEGVGLAMTGSHDHLGRDSPCTTENSQTTEHNEDENDHMQTLREDTRKLLKAVASVKAVVSTFQQDIPAMIRRAVFEAMKVKYPVCHNEPTRYTKLGQKENEKVQDSGRCVPAPYSCIMNTSEERKGIQAFISPQRLLESERCADFKKMTCNLMKAVFTREEILTRSVTGRRGKGMDEAREALDAEKVQAIVDRVISRFPHADRNMVIAKMGQKLKDERIANGRSSSKD
ncbi:NGFI-A-binding protein 2-like [Acipenser ruthenus]|uniref:NGFI-A-binding protein 2-like n=1 Tax=Acipenser ruthenus TaxID=7906 RepID=UPI0027410DD5|nr:NGFI-A-binding protein 2-like [Acipenser ruthenus]XP_058847407.1 NGFI-A-binding protein 2-like [Acipenser ruthenus]